VSLQQVCWEPHAAQGQDVHDGEVKYCRHFPPMQVWSGAQALVWAHPPQCSQSELSWSADRQLPAQIMVPTGQSAVQAPDEQYVTPGVHIVPHMPQCIGSVLVSTHPPLHIERPGRQPHWPLSQRSGWLHGLLQAPQVKPLLLAFWSVHTPGAGVSHFTAPLQAQAPFVQTAPSGQCMPHVPQLSASAMRSTVTQAAAPEAGHVPVGQPHAPFLQTMPGAHLLLQTPQLLGSVLVLTHMAGVPHIA
jgi:hypothetical protein